MATQSLHCQVLQQVKLWTLDFGTAYADADLKIIATVNRSIANSKTKTLQNNSTKQAYIKSN